MLLPVDLSFVLAIQDNVHLRHLLNGRFAVVLNRPIPLKSIFRFTMRSDLGNLPGLVISKHSSIVAANQKQMFASQPVTIVPQRVRRKINDVDDTSGQIPLKRTVHQGLKLIQMMVCDNGADWRWCCAPHGPFLSAFPWEPEEHHHERQ